MSVRACCTHMLHAHEHCRFVPWGRGCRPAVWGTAARRTLLSPVRLPSNPDLQHSNNSVMTEVTQICNTITTALWQCQTFAATLSVACRWMPPKIPPFGKLSVAFESGEAYNCCTVAVMPGLESKSGCISRHDWTARYVMLWHIAQAALCLALWKTHSPLYITCPVYVLCVCNLRQTSWSESAESSFCVKRLQSILGSGFCAQSRWPTKIWRAKGQVEGHCQRFFLAQRHMKKHKRACWISPMHIQKHTPKGLQKSTQTGATPSSTAAGRIHAIVVYMLWVECSPKV